MAWGGLKTTDTWQDKYFSAKMKKIQDFYFGPVGCLAPRELTSEPVS
jgi:hypothetical protein